MVLRLFDRTAQAFPFFKRYTVTHAPKTRINKSKRPFCPTTLEGVIDALHPDKTVINGVTVADCDGTGRLDDETHRAHNVGMKGHIALQIHKNDQVKIRFRDIAIVDLTPR